jgi:putative transposase
VAAYSEEYGGLRTDQAQRLKELETENNRLTKIVADLTPDNALLRKPCGNVNGVISQGKRREVVSQVQKTFGISERRAYRAIEQPRSSQLYEGQTPGDEEPLTQRVIKLALKYSRYGYCRISSLLLNEGCLVHIQRGHITSG